MNINEPTLQKSRYEALYTVQDKVVPPTTQCQLPQLVVTLIQIQEQYLSEPYILLAIYYVRHNHLLLDTYYINPFVPETNIEIMHYLI